MEHPISLLYAHFTLPLYPRQIGQWRGAVAGQAGWEEEVFHNHAGDKDSYHYAYPLVQYRCQGGRAAILGINEGAEAVRSWLFRSSGEIWMNGRAHELKVEAYREEQAALAFTETTRVYRLMDWLPLNTDNYKLWLATHDLVGRVELLNRLLAGNLLALASGLGWQIPGRFDARLLNLKQLRTVSHHGTGHLAFNVLFTSNLLLPSGTALGKGVSHGFGILHQSGEL